MAGLQVPLSTLRLAPRDALRMTRGQSGLLFLHCWRLSLFTLCRSPGAQAYDFFRFVRSGVFRLQTEVVLMLASSFVNITELIDRCPLGPLQISIIALCGLVTLLDFADRICAHCQNAPV
jgi:hypothetical protein